MATYYGIEESTDVGYPLTKITRLPSEAAAREWVQNDQGFAFPGAAREDLPVPQQNWHRRVRSVLVMPPGFELSQRELRKTVEKRRRYAYRSVRTEDVRAYLLRCHADFRIYPEPAEAKP